MTRSIVHLLPFALVLLMTESALTQETDPAPPAAQKINPQRVLASVGGEPIYAAELGRHLRTAVQGRELNSGTITLVQAKLLDQLIKRRLVGMFLARTDSGVSDAEIDAAMEQLEAKLASQEKSLDELVEAGAVSKTALRKQAAFELGLKKYLAENINDQNLQKFFDAHRKEYDGSEISVRHILLRPERSGDTQAVAELMQKAAQIREAITSGKISFEDAAEQYSAGPSRRDGGRLGFIPRHGVMVETFSQAAFSLDEGAISNPVKTRFGVHLIRCDKVKPGSKNWTDVREQLVASLTEAMFARLASEESKQSKVQYSGAIPFLHPQTGQLVVPRAAGQ